MDPTTIIAIAKTVLPWAVAGGAAYQGVKTGLNGTKERVSKLEQNAFAHEQKDQVRHIEMVDRLARIETKLDDIHSRGN